MTLETNADLDSRSTVRSAPELRVVVDDGLDAWRDKFAAGLIGEDESFLAILRSIRRAASRNVTVLLKGESGTGKEEAALTIHRASPRAAGAFIAINCAAIPETLVEAELFGHAKGAFTNAVGAREGRIAAANGGTLFLDEIGDMPLAAQAKLLRVLQQREVVPVGADRPTTVDIRLVAATNKNLEEMVDAGTFREDLFYRLSVLTLQMPALRERPIDVVPLATHFIRLGAQRHGSGVPTLSAAAQTALRAHSWRGNIRELSNVVERALVMCAEDRIEAIDLGLPPRGGRRPGIQTPVGPLPTLTDDAAPSATSSTGVISATEALNLRLALDQLERKMIDEALRRSGGNRTEAAAILGLNRSTLVEKLRRFG